MELIKLLLAHRYSVKIFFHILVLQKYWVLIEIRILLKLGGIRILVLSISSHEGFNKTEGIVFSLFRKDPFLDFLFIFGVHLKQLQIKNNEISDFAPSVL